MTTEFEVIEEISETIKAQIPKMYKVLLHNDDTTTFDFVIMVLVSIFHKTLEDSIELAKKIDAQGQGIAGSPYTKEIAEEKTHETVKFSRANNFPLIATYEEL